MAALTAVFGTTFTSCSNSDDDLTRGGSVIKDMSKVITANAYMDNPASPRSYAANENDIKTDGMLVWAFDATRENAITDANDFFMGTPAAGLAHTWDADNSWFKADKDYFWPEYKLNFVAITPRTGGGIGEVNIKQPAKSGTTLQKPVMTVKVDVPRTTESNGTYGADTQKDIMIASIDDQTPLTNQSAAFTFKHALSQIVFKGGVDAQTTIHRAVVKSIKLVNIASDGTITYTAATDAFAASEWGDKNKTYAANIKNKEVTAKIGYANSDLDETPNNISGQDNNATGRDYQMMIMPQQSVVCTGVTSGVNISQKTQPTAGTYLLVNADLYANGNNSNKILENTTNVYIPLEQTTWMPGYKYIYLLKFGDNLLSPITFTATVAPWTNANKPVEF